MRFDIPTLLSLLLIQVLVLALVLPVLMGWKVSRAARCAQGATALQAAGWLALLLSPLAGSLLEPWLAALALGLLSGGLSALWWALRTWLGERPGRWLMPALPLLLPLGYLLAADNYPIRVGLANAGLGLQLALLALACGLPPGGGAPLAQAESQRWRLLLLVSMAALALATLWRGAVGALDPASYPTLASPHPVNISALVLAHIAVMISMLAVLVAWRGETEAALQRMSQTDALTGLANRRALVGRAAEMMSMARRYDEPLALMMLDLHGLKAVNEQHGQVAGDQALALFAACLTQVQRIGDVVGRVGGEEFAVLLARSDGQGPQALDARLRSALADRAPKELGFALDFSAGWAKLRHGDRNIEDLLRRAEAALYEAKRSGSGRLYAEPGVED
ncbi:GGDEF domain-containing protein [Paucibacter sp. APW11]|uniref:diguanylate cyclase n=1 Tax=Roseateles aquae TaxID=3077235 RepID=A0ABU3PIL7_9BURK|nr:GGDEF domain-containing protein [Paucibacter sp. APW11]MDT9002373.1 GGDEF domain-containing protein [Paucibacter sp. APW11]